MITIDELLNGARSWLGVPFAHQGRSRFGVDCVGYPIALFRELNLLPRNFEDEHNYGRNPDGRMEGLIKRYCPPTKAADVGTLLLIQWPGMKYPSHVAVCTGRTIVHAYQRAGFVVENGYRGAWVKNFHSAFRFPGVSYE